MYIFSFIMYINTHTHMYVYIYIHGFTRFSINDSVYEVYRDYDRCNRFCKVVTILTYPYIIYECIYAYIYVCITYIMNVNTVIRSNNLDIDRPL